MIAIKEWALVKRGFMAVVVLATVVAVALASAGCGDKSEADVTIIGGADGATAIFLAEKSVSKVGLKAQPPIWFISRRARLRSK